MPLAFDGLGILQSTSSNARPPRPKRRSVQSAAAAGVAELVRRGAFYCAHPKYLYYERTKKLDFASELSEARAALLRGESDWRTQMKRAIRSELNNLMYGPYQSRFNRWVESGTNAGVALGALWDDTVPVEARVSTFVKQLPRGDLKLPSASLEVTSVLLMALGAERHPPMRTKAFAWGLKLTGTSASKRTDGGASRYVNGLALLDAILDESRRLGAPLVDRLDAQSAVWCSYHGELGTMGWPPVPDGFRI